MEIQEGRGHSRQPVNFAVGGLGKDAFKPSGIAGIKYQRLERSSRAPDCTSAEDTARREQARGEFANMSDEELRQYVYGNKELDA